MSHQKHGRQITKQRDGRNPSLKFLVQNVIPRHRIKRSGEEKRLRIKERRRRTGQRVGVWRDVGPYEQEVWDVALKENSALPGTPRPTC